MSWALVLLWDMSFSPHKFEETTAFEILWQNRLDFRLDFKQSP